MASQPFPREFFVIDRSASFIEPPSVFSFSSISEIERCPRRWQLERSGWPGAGRYPLPFSRPTAEGRVVHRALEAAVQRLVAAGGPALGTPKAARALAAVGSDIESAIGDELRSIRGNPRCWRVEDLGIEVAHCRNVTFRLLRRAWGTTQGKRVPPALVVPGDQATPTNLRAIGASAAASAGPRGLDPYGTEVELRHPTLPFRGVIDLVMPGINGARLIDYKTGALDASYADQLLTYGVLWWRRTGEPPAELRLLGGQSSDAFVLHPTHLDCARAEDELRLRIEQCRSDVSTIPAEARPDASVCRSCPVRHRCEGYWASAATAALRGDTGSSRFDLAAQVVEVRSQAALEVEVEGPVAADDTRALVTGAPGFGVPLDAYPVGRHLRVLGASSGLDGSTRLDRGSEVFELL